MQIKRFEKEHLQDAAVLCVAEYKRQREVTPLLPERYESVETMRAKLQRLLGKNPGVVAVEDGQLVGYLIGAMVDKLKGEDKGVVIPEWCHAAVGQKKGRIYQEMYKMISEYWVYHSHLNQAIIMYANDQVARDEWFRFGFGMIGIDAIRPLAGVETSASDVEVKLAGLSDIDAILSLSIPHEMYYGEGPTFLPKFVFDDRKYFENRLARPDQAIWLAYIGGEPVGFMFSQGANEGASDMIFDAKTASINGAFTRPDYRGRGIGAKLLARIVEWAKESGYERLTVDFESANIYGSRFWLTHFEPISYSLLRHIDDRMPYAANRLESVGELFK